LTSFLEAAELALCMTSQFGISLEAHNRYGALASEHKKDGAVSKLVTEAQDSLVIKSKRFHDSG
jgi:hypothetical protein